MELKDIQKQFKELQEKMKKDGETAFKKAAKEMLDKFPRVEAFKWSQYTPSWNDGSPCTFSINEESFAIKLVLPEGKTEWTDEDGCDEDGRWDFDLEDEEEKALNELASLGGPEEFIEILFGTNVTVTVTRDEISVDHYDCGW